MNKEEVLYIAGPNCFWPTGENSLQAYREYSIFHGFNVALPRKRETPEEKEKSDKAWESMSKKERGANILQKCIDAMAETTAIIANLDNYRGYSPDGGTIFEIGMAYAKGCKCYAYARDMRPTGEKFSGGTWGSHGLYDDKGRKVPNIDLPFSVNIIGSCKIVEGNYFEALHMLMADIAEESKMKIQSKKEEKISSEKTYKSDKPIVYFSDFDRYEENAKEKYDKIKRLLEDKGFEVFVPIDKCPGVEDIYIEDDRYAQVFNEFNHYQQHIRNCDIILADLNDYYGHEPNSDVSFECGMAMQLDKKLYAFMDDISNMIERVPNKGEENDYRDFNNMGVENFDAPVNLMFGSSFKFFDGNIEEVIDKMAEDYKNNK